MAIIHDAYLFNPIRYVTNMSVYTDALIQDWPKGYGKLRKEAIALYDQNPRVRELAQEYGGWDRTSITRQVSSSPQGPEDIAFWYTLLLYGQLAEYRADPAGLGTNWRAAGIALEHMGLPQTERNLITKGHRFQELVPKLFHNPDSFAEDVKRMYEVWTYLGRFSTGGSAGWIEHAEAKDLLARFTQYQFPKERDRSTQEILGRVVEMLDAANREETGLCVVLSG